MGADPFANCETEEDGGCLVWPVSTPSPLGAIAPSLIGLGWGSSGETSKFGASMAGSSLQG